MSESHEATEGHPSPVAVIDIDGVLSDSRHRRHHLRAPRKDWDGFFRDAIDDPLIPEGRERAWAAVADGLTVAYLTGRPERCRTETVAWLDEHGLPRGDLIMRPERDRRPAAVFKVQALRDLAVTAHVAWLLDDDPAVVTAARTAGFTALQADWVAAGTA